MIVELVVELVVELLVLLAVVLLSVLLSVELLLVEFTVALGVVGSMNKAAIIPLMRSGIEFSRYIEAPYVLYTDNSKKLTS